MATGVQVSKDGVGYPFSRPKRPVDFRCGRGRARRHGAPVMSDSFALPRGNVTGPVDISVAAPTGVSHF